MGWLGRVQYDEEPLNYRPLIDVVVNVTEDHITRGVRRACSVCPIALALLELTNCPSIHVGGRTADLHPPDSRGVFVTTLPAEAGLFVKDFDSNNGLAKPFSFTLFNMPAWLFKERNKNYVLAQRE